MQRSSHAPARRPVRRPIFRRGRSRPAPHPQPVAPARAVQPRRPARRRSGLRLRDFALLALAGVLLLSGACLFAMLIGGGLIYGSGNVLPGVSAAGVDLGGMSQAEAESALASAWGGGVVLRDGTRTWPVSAADLGVSLDAAATASAAHEWGRGSGGIDGALRALTSGVDVPPVLVVDLDRLQRGLESVRAMVEAPAVNAGVSLVGGRVMPSPAQPGRALDLGATVERMRVASAAELADGALDLVMIAVAPSIMDASALVAQAEALLSSPFTLRGYDPVHDEWTTWSAPPEVWAGWLSAEDAPGSATGLSLSMNHAGPQAFVESNAQFPDERYIKPEEAIAAMQAAARRGETTASVRVWNGPTTYTVRGGQTLAAIAEEVGIPYPYIEAENPGMNTDALSVGQAIQLPARDVLIPLDPIPSKRIVVSRSQQHLWAYENGQVVFDWVISTGLPSSPTALGVFQVQTHELNAYAQQWNLYMPHFMGFYHPGPNMDLINGFHGFPTRGGGYLLWSGDLGHPVTYGCVLLSLENAESLYNWAEDGVIVEVQG